MAYELSPIILTGGIATGVGGSLPILSLTQGLNLNQGLLQGSSNIDPNSFFARFRPVPGGSLINNQVSQYPFANQSVAANAIIAQPLKISMIMTCPAGPAGGFPAKQTTMIALQNSLAQHNNAGGTYTIMTPSFIYTDCIMTGMQDVSGGDSNQAQYQWQLDFVQPLVSIAAAQNAQNNLMQKLGDGTSQPAPPSIDSALQATGSTTDDLASPIASGLSQSFSAAGVSTPNMGSFVSSTVQNVVSTGGSPGDLANVLTANLTQAANQAGFSFSTLQGMVNTQVANGLNAVGVTSDGYSALVKSSLSQLATKTQALPINAAINFAQVS